MTQIPCKDCIVFVMCKWQITEYMHGYKSVYKTFQESPTTLMYYGYIDILKPNCSIIKNWMNEHPPISEQIKALTDVYSIC